MNRHDTRAATRAEVRGHILKTLYAARWDWLSEGVLRGEIEEAGHEITRTELIRDIQYLKGKQLCYAESRGDGRWRGRISSQGVDVAECTAAAVTGVQCPDDVTVEVRKLREARWHALLTLEIGMPFPTSERVVLTAINGPESEISEVGLRRELVYLQELGLVEITEGSVWRAQLTPSGSDVAQFTSEAPPGVDRVDKYWT